ncbi:30S ribosomal protein S8 [bacterium]|nr:MAG: 30S ribosomal protein S8 [bacterium]
MGVIIDPIADMLARIKNSQSRLKATVSMPHSRIKHQIARILTEEGYIRGYKIIALPGDKKILKLYLKYQDKNPSIKGLVRVSKPGRRIYSKLSSLPSVRGGLGIAILSTPRGVLTDRQAKLLHVGGEVLCYVW